MSSGSSGSKNYKVIGEEAWKKCDKIPGELFTFTYGALVASLFREHPTDIPSVNQQLDRMGHSMGSRLIDEFLARTSLRCGPTVDFRDALEIIAKVAFRQYLNVNATLVRMDEQEAVISLDSDGLGGELVELPDEAVKGGLRYANVLCGMIRGALEMVNVLVECAIVTDPLLSSNSTTTDISIKFVKYLEEELPPSND